MVNTTFIREEETDYKRLLHKNKKIASRIHKKSPAYNSIVYLNHLPTKKKFDFFALFNQHEDIYFNSSRNDLSKDIFPSE